MHTDYIDYILYCNLCGARFVTQNRGMLVCPEKHEFYVNPKMCTGAILTNNLGEVLLVQRKAPPNAGYWDLPGGFIDVDETLEEGMQRELVEELGVQAENLTYFASVVDNYMYQNIPYPTLNAIFTGTIPDTNLTVTDDVQGYRFFQIRSLPLDIIAFESFTQILREYAEKNSK